MTSAVSRSTSWGVAGLLTLPATFVVGVAAVDGGGLVGFVVFVTW